MSRGFSQFYFLELLIRNLPFDRFSEKEFWKLIDRSPELSSIFQNFGEINLPILTSLEPKCFWKFVYDNDWALDFLRFVEFKKYPIGLKEFLWPEHFKISNGSKPVEVFSEAVSLFVWFFSAYRSGNFCGFLVKKTKKKESSKNENPFVKRVSTLLNRDLSWFEIANELELSLDELKSSLKMNRDHLSNDSVRSKMEALLLGDYVKTNSGWVHPSGLFLNDSTRGNLLSLIRESGMTEKDFFIYLWEVKYEIGAMNKLEEFLGMKSRIIVSFVRYHRGTLFLSSPNISPRLR